MALGTDADLGTGYIMHDGDPDLPTEKGTHSRLPPIFGPFLLWPNCWMHQDATWYGGRPRPRPYFARWGPSSPKRESNLQLSAHVNCGQTSTWIKMHLVRR